MGGVGTGFAVNGDRIPAAWLLRRRHRGDEVRIVVERVTCAGMRICVQADGNAQVLRGYLEDNGVLEVARAVGCGI
jgi:hypothetical protein